MTHIVSELRMRHSSAYLLTYSEAKSAEYADMQLIILMVYSVAGCQETALKTEDEDLLQVNSWATVAASADQADQVSPELTNIPSYLINFM